MQAVDVTNMSNKEIEKVGTAPMDVELVDGIAIPLQKRSAKQIGVRSTKKNLKLINDYGEKIFNKYGQLNLGAYDPRKLLQKINRQDPKTQKWTLKSAGPKLIQVMLEEVLPGSDLKGKTKDRLDKILRKALSTGSKRAGAKKRTVENTTAHKKKKEITVPIEPEKI